MPRKLALKGAGFARSIHVSPRMGVVYVNNPKVACSTIKLTLQRAELDDPGWKPPKSVHDRAGSPLLTDPQIRGREDEAMAGKIVFSFVRNPYGRLRSAYLNKIVSGQKKGRPREHAGFDADTCPSFRDFVLSICAQDPFTHNPHWRPQALNLSVDRVRFDFIGRLERFAEDWATLAARTGLPAQTDFAGKRTPSADKAELGFDAEMAQAVQAAYAADFAHFGYDTAAPA